MKFSLSIIVVILMINNVMSDGKGKCPVPKDWIKEPIEDTKLLGKWYAIASNYIDEQVKVDCPHFMYTHTQPEIKNNLKSSVHGFSHDHGADSHGLDYLGKALFGSFYEPGTWIESYLKKDYYGHDADDKGHQYIGTLEFKVYLLMMENDAALVYGCHEEADGTFIEYVDMMAKNPSVDKVFMDKSWDVLGESGLLEKGIRNVHTDYDMSKC